MTTLKRFFALAIILMVAVSFWAFLATPTTHANPVTPAATQTVELSPCEAASIRTGNNECGM